MAYRPQLLTVPFGGTGQATLTNHGVLVGAATAAVTQLSVGTNGQVLIGASAADPAFATLTSSDSSITFTTGANTLSLQVTGGTSVGKTITGQSGGALSPTAGNWNISGAVTAAGTSPVVTSGAVSTLTVNVQTSQAIAATDATKIGLANFNSAQFTVDTNGFVSATGTIPLSFATDSGTATPAAGSVSILGGPGVTTSGSGSTVTINAVTFTSTAATTLAVDNGYFATAAGTYALPVTSTSGSKIIITCDASGVIVDAPAAVIIRFGNTDTAASGTITSTAVGDSVTMIYRNSTSTWYVISSIGNWTIS